jgi:hypothetical protein
MTESTLNDHMTRYALNVPVRYHRVAERRYRREGGWIRDLNLRGAWVELPERVPAGSALALALDTPTGDLTLLAHVAWTCSGLRDAPYLHGLRFTGLTPERRRRLQVLIAHEKPPAVIRLYCRLAATCRRNDNGCHAMSGLLRDLDDGGACVRLPERVPPGTEMRISVRTAYGRIAAETKVVWADPPGRLPKDASYRHGLRFLRVDSSSELPLRALLEGFR